MAVVERVVPATPERVFAVLADGWTYSDWVVGTAHIRDVDAEWPDPGAHIYFHTATWPLAINEKTVSLEVDPPFSLLMRPHLWPLGEYTVRFTLTPLDGQETKVTMAEELTAGPMRGLRRRLEDLPMHWRNAESLKRLADLATRRMTQLYIVR